MKPAASLHFIPLALLLLGWLLYGQESNLQDALGLAAGSDQARWLHWTLATLLWLGGTLLLNQFIRLVIYDRIVARAIGGPVPGVLKTMTSLLVLLVAATLIVGMVYERSVTAFLAALGASGVVLGFALRSLIADVFTGLAINMDRSFVIGDWVMVNEGASGVTVGQIEEIGWRCTTLHTEEKTSVVIPNGLLGLERMVNITRPMLPTRFETTVTVEFSVSPLRVKRVLSAAMRALEAVPGFDDQKAPEVLVKETSASGVEYLLRYWIRPWDPISPTKAEDRVMASVLQHLHTAGISLAYPKTDLYYAPMPVRQYDEHQHDDLVALLAQLKLFEPLAPRDLQEISESMERHHLQAGETLVREGEKGKSLFVLIEGLLDAFVVRGSQEEQVGRIEPGNCIGEMSLLTGERRTATVRAATECIVYEISKKPMRHIMERNPTLTEKLAQLLAEHQLETEQALDRKERTRETGSMDSFTASLVRRMREFLDLQRAGA